MMFDDDRFYRFSELKRLGLVPNWPTLKRWQEQGGFPSGRLAGPNFRVWTGRELNKYVASLPTGPAKRKGAVKPAAKRKGRK